MKPQSQRKRRTRQLAANLVPSFEECLTYMMDKLGPSRDGLTTYPLLPKEKQRFRQMERKADALDLDEYRGVLRRVLAPGLHELTAESKAHVDLLHEELREFLKRYEILNWQVVPGPATQSQVLWALSHRFFLPWLALRIAYRLRDDSESMGDCWFLPRRGSGLDSCVMKVIDQFVRQSGESNARLARRIHEIKPKGETRKRSIKEISDQAEREEDARHLEDNLSKYRHFKTSPPDETIDLIVINAKQVPHLRLMLVLARFIDRCVRDALEVFGEENMLILVNFFEHCFFHFRSVVKQVCREIPETERNNVWLWLSSPTFMGNTPGEQERFFPLMDDYMNELPRKINAEIGRTICTGKLQSLPNKHDGLNTTRRQMPRSVPIPEEIESAPFRGTVPSAVAVSCRKFRGRINLVSAEKARRRFEFLGLGTFAFAAGGHKGLCSEEDATLAETECKRLNRLIYKQTPASRRPNVALQFLIYLIEPFRPKSHADRAQAQELFTIVSRHLHRDRLLGAVKYLEGCLYLLEGHHKKALNVFAAARKLGRESCGRFWIDLLRRGLVTAQHFGSKREEKNFAKIAHLFGVFSNDATPRTNELKAQMKEDDYRKAWFSALKSFPRV